MIPHGDFVGVLYRSYLKLVSSSNQKPVPETEEPFALVNTALTDLEAKPETEEPVDLVTTDVTELKAEPEPMEPVAPVTRKMNPRPESLSLVRPPNPPT